jgi:hypothetical protein
VYLIAQGKDGDTELASDLLKVMCFCFQKKSCIPLLKELHPFAPFVLETVVITRSYSTIVSIMPWVWDPFLLC